MISVLSLSQLLGNDPVAPAPLRYSLTVPMQRASFQDVFIPLALSRTFLCSCPKAVHYGVALLCTSQFLDLFAGWGGSILCACLVFQIQPPQVFLKPKRGCCLCVHCHAAPCQILSFPTTECFVFIFQLRSSITMSW